MTADDKPVVKGRGERRRSDPQESEGRRTRYRAIGRELRRMFDEVVQEPVPPEMVELLRKLEAQGDSSDSEAP